jgi:hypothetical protein
MWHTNKFKTLLTAIFCLIALNFHGQTFSVISDTTITSLTPNVIVAGNDFLTISTGYDTIGTTVTRPLIIQKYNQSGELLFHHAYWNAQNLITPLLDANLLLYDTEVVFAGNKYNGENPEELGLLLYLNFNGDTLYSNTFISPYFEESNAPSNWNRPTAITTDGSGQIIYMVSQVVDYPPIQNNFIIRKINAEGEVLWTYINPLDEWYYSANDLTFKNDTLWFISIASGNLGHYNKLMGLSPDSGEVIFEVEHNGASFPVGGCEDMILTDDGPVIANTIGDSDGTLPFLYKMDFAGNYIWQAQPLGDFAYGQTNNHLVQSGDGGFVSCGEKYDEEPSWLYPNDPAMNNTMKRIWLWKVDADGNFLWQRFYAYYDFDYSEEYFHLTNIAHDMKATPDGGFIMAGEASASCTNYPTCDEFTQQGWLLKVDGCGCLVPGCDPGCIVGIEEIVAEDEIKYFRFGPNPVSDLLNLYIPSLSIPMNELNFSLYDNLGRKVNDFQFKFDDTTYMIDASNLASGEYILLLSQNGKTLQSEVIIVQ